MIRLNEQKPTDHHYLPDVDDLLRIQKALFIHRGLFVSLDEAAILWQDYSNDLCASWLILPDELEKIPEYIESNDLFKGYN